MLSAYTQDEVTFINNLKFNLISLASWTWLPVSYLVVGNAPQVLLFLYYFPWHFWISITCYVSHIFHFFCTVWFIDWFSMSSQWAGHAGGAFIGYDSFVACDYFFTLLSTISVNIHLPYFYLYFFFSFFSFTCCCCNLCTMRFNCEKKQCTLTVSIFVII